MKEFKDGDVITGQETVKVRALKLDDPRKQKMKADKVYDVHPIHAENLIESGAAELIEEGAAKTTKKK